MARERRPRGVRIEGELVEPAQRAFVTFSPNEPTDLSAAIAGLPPEASAHFGVAAVAAFRDFKDKRERVPYR